jgi:hypothetical protein
MVHTTKPQDGESTHAWKKNEATKKLKKNERQRRYKQQQIIAIHNVVSGHC